MAESWKSRDVKKPWPYTGSGPLGDLPGRVFFQEWIEDKGYKIKLQLYIQSNKRILYTRRELSLSEEIGNNDTFLLPFKSFNRRVIASDGMGWEHGSVSLPNRTPN